MGKAYNRSTGYRPRKRKYHGSKGTDSSNISLLNISASSKKLHLDVSNCNLNSEKEDMTGYRLIDISVLFPALSKQMCCKVCKSDVSFSENKIRGAASAFSIKCDCVLESNINSCVMLGSKKNIPEVNTRLVYSMRCIGVGLRGLQTFCGIMNMLPPITRRSYDKINKKILHATQKVAEKSMIKAGQEETELSSSSDIVVSGDGTWKTRGHSSKIGVCSVIGIETGKVVDVEVLTNFCISCEKNISPHSCVKNHTGSAGAMEVAGMKRIFSRSVSDRGVRYLKYLGDGDAKTYNEVCKAKPYGDVEIEKLECVGHVQKRMGTRLRKHKEKMKGSKLADGKPLSGRGRLTDVLIDKISVYYGNAIRGNTESVEAMKKAIWAIYCHLSSNDAEPMHMFCPTGETSWCKYQKHVASGNAAPFRHTNNVPVEVMKSIKKIFSDLASPELLKKCLSGKTQNQNESFNSVLWQICPKISGSSKIVADIAANEAIITFNGGKLGRRDTLYELDMIPGKYEQYAMKADLLRIKVAEKRASMASLEARRVRRQAGKNKNELLKKKEGNVYNPGCY